MAAPASTVDGFPSVGGTSAPNSTWSAAWRLLRFSVAAGPRAFAFTVAAALAGSLAEGAALVLLLPLLAVAGMGLAGSSTADRLAVESQHLLTRAHTQHALWLPAMLGLLLAVGALRSMLRRAQSMLIYSTTTGVQLALSRRVYGAVVKAQWGFLVRQSAGKLTHLLTGEMRHVEDAVGLSLSIINIGCLTLLYLGVACRLSAPMTLLVLLMGGALTMLQRSSLDRIRAGGDDLSQSAGEIHAATGEHLQNLKTVKTCNAEERDVRLYAGLCDRMAGHVVGIARQEARASFRFEVGSLAAICAVVFLALGVLHVQAGTMLLLLAIFTRLMPQFANLQSQAHQLASVLPSFDRVRALEADCAAKAEPNPPPAGWCAPGAAAPSLEHELHLENVWFAYDTSSKKLAGTSNCADWPTMGLEFGLGGPESDLCASEFVLRGVDLRIHAGMLTAITGVSGAGKSTLADLANGLLQPTLGRLLVDGREMRPAEMAQWRRRVGYVGQETVLFHLSVRENLLWARPEATADELHEALHRACAEFVYDLPDGLETMVGDRGILLSSGQRQRISLARALLRQPSLLILDEATNSLDVENEGRILDAILNAIRDAALNSREGLTVLMIAHRSSALCRADRIFELGDGCIARTRAPYDTEVEAHA
jgi:ATP-binding cassette subfamily C protein